MKKSLITFLASLTLSAPFLTAQAIPDSLFTVGTTATDAQNRPWAFLAFRPADAGVLSGRSLAIYQKNGLPADPGNFTKVGVVAPELETSVLSVLLNRGEQIGENLTELDGILFDLYRTRTGEKNSVTDLPPATEKPPLAEMLSSLLMRATADAETAQLLRVLGQAHPSVKMALGEGWAGPLTAAPGQPVTLEAREWTTDGTGGVVGRVTLTAGMPVLLPAPGPPVQVPDLTPKGDLNVKLRWGLDDDLRRQSPLSGGFRVWRVLKSFAQANGVDAAAPSLSQLKTWQASNNAKLASDKPVLVSKLFTSAEAALVTGPGSDGTTYFLTDDGGRYRNDAQGNRMDDPLAEGTEFTYFITSLDILGRDGPPSLPGHAIVCRTLPPPVPGDLRLENHWQPDANPAAATGTQSLQFFWKANTNTARDETTYYEIYRGDNLTPLQSPEGKEGLDNAGPIDTPQLHQVDGALMSYIDESPEILGKGFGETLWYSVRAVHLCPLGPIKSDFAAPVMIAKRQREGPDAPSGRVSGNCGRASVIFASNQLTTPADVPANDGLVRLRVLCQRLDHGIAHADLSVRIGSVVTDLGQHIFAADSDWVAADFEIHNSELAGQVVTTICQTTTHTGKLSNPKEYTSGHLSSEGRREIVFQTKTLSDAEITPGEAFSNELLEEPQAATAVATPEGVGRATVPQLLEGRAMVIQMAAAFTAFVSWTTVGHGEAVDSQVFFSIAASENPLAMTCRVFPIRDFGGECSDLAFDPGTGLSGKLGVVIFTTPRSSEYRLFRRVNEGPYTLVGQGGAAYAATNPVNAIRREDDALPLTDCTISYYAQTVDRDGNASAMVRLEPSIERKAPTLPKPRLSPPAAIGDASAPKMLLTWMCPPQGVDRFVVTIKSKGGAAAQSLLENAASLQLVSPISSALAARQVFYLSSDSEGKAAPVTQAPGPVSQAGNADNRSILSLATGRLAFQKLLQKSSFVTPPLGNGFPTEPPFTAEFTVQPGVTYTVFVQAARGDLALGKGRGPASATYEFKWEVPTVGPEPQVAWPARPMPEVTTVQGVEAGEVDPVLWPANLNGQQPVGVKFASLPTQGTEDFFQPSGTVVYAPRSSSPGYRRRDPNKHLPRPIGDGTRQVQGVVLYRQQVANQLFPVVPGDTLQVSPLIRKIAWIAQVTEGRDASLLIDPYFAVAYRPPPPVGQFVAQANRAFLDLWLLDTQGVVNGARYHYFLVCFGTDGEITQTIDAGYYGPN